MKCCATVNVFGYPLSEPCDEADENLREWHNVAMGLTSERCKSESEGCAHHKPAYDPFDAWVEEARSESAANSRTK